MAAMNDWIERILGFLPYLIMGVIVGSLLIFLLATPLSYDQYVGIVRVLIWPCIVLMALLFFRKVFTYLFFTMESFNFFGAHGRLKNITEVIDEKVEERLKNLRGEQERNAEISKIAAEFEAANQSKESSEKRASANLELAKDIFKDYRGVSQKLSAATKELELLREEKAAREQRMRALRERVDQRRAARNSEMHRSSNGSVDPDDAPF